MNELSPFGIISNYHQCLSGIKLLTKLNNALQVIIENFLTFKISFAIWQSLLISLNHHEYNLLVLIRAFKEILQESLIKNFLHFCIIIVIMTFHIFRILLLIFLNMMFTFIFFSWSVFIDCIILTLLLNLIIVIFYQRWRGFIFSTFRSLVKVLSFCLHRACCFCAVLVLTIHSWLVLTKWCCWLLFLIHLLKLRGSRFILCLLSYRLLF